MGESSSEEAGRTDKMGKDNGVSRAVADDDTALLLSAVESFRNVALGRLRNGSEASRILDQEMSTRLLHLACRHDAAECARLLLDGGHGITAPLVDARDQLMRTPLHIAAEKHSARCIQLLLSRNARTDLRVVDGRPLIALEVALNESIHACFLFRVQVDWSVDNTVEDVLAYLGNRQPLPEKCLPSWFFIFRKWLPGFLVEAAERYRQRYPLSSVKTDFRSICRMELDHAALGYPKLSDFIRSLPGICRMCVVPVGKGPATHMVLLPPISRPKYVPLLEPYSFDHDELPESVSDHESPRSPLSANITDDSPHNTDGQHGDVSSESNVQSQHDDEYSRSNAESPRDSDSASNGSLLDEIPVSTTKLDLIELPTRKPDLLVSGPAPQRNEPEPLRKHDLVESGPLPGRVDTGASRKPDLVESAPTRKLDLVESRPPGNPDLAGPGPARKLDVIESRPTRCFVDRPAERAALTPSSRNNEMKFSFFHSQWDMYLTPHPKNDYCIICRSCEAAMELVPCLHKICVACMMRCNVRACMTCGTAVSGVKSSPSMDKKCRQGVMERVSDQKCQLMVVCSGADAIVRCSPCMHTIACRGCLLASVTLLKNCTVCDGVIEHFKFGSQGLAP